MIDLDRLRLLGRVKEGVRAAHAVSGGGVASDALALALSTLDELSRAEAENRSGDEDEDTLSLNTEDAGGHEHKGKGVGGGQFTSHGYSNAQLAAMSPARRKSLAGIGMKMPTKGKTDEEIHAALRVPEGAEKSGEAKQTPTAKPLPPASHKAAFAALVVAKNAGEQSGGGDPRGDLRHLPTGERLKQVVGAIETVADAHIKRTTVGIPLDQLYAGLGDANLTPEEFRATLIHLHQSGRYRLGGWAKMLDDIPRPDLTPVVASKVMGYLQPNARTELSTDEDGEDDGKLLALEYADLWSALEASGVEIAEEDVDAALEELEGSGWTVARDEDGDWAAVAEGVELATEHAPAGGIEISGVRYSGGMFIPSSVMAHASAADKKRLAAAKDAAEVKKSKKTEERKGRGLDHAKLTERLVPHAGKELTAAERTSAARSFRLLHRHHGELVLHRVEELADQAQRGLDALTDDHPHSDHLRNYFTSQLAKYHGMLGMAEEAGVEVPKVKAAGKEASAAGVLAKAASDGIPASLDTKEQATAFAHVLRAALEEASGSEGSAEWCSDAAMVVKQFYPTAENWQGTVPTKDGPEDHTVSKVGDHFIDVSSDQFGHDKVVVTDSLDPAKYTDFKKSSWPGDGKTLDPAYDERALKMMDVLKANGIEPAKEKEGGAPPQPPPAAVPAPAAGGEAKAKGGKEPHEMTSDEYQSRKRAEVPKPSGSATVTLEHGLGYSGKMGGKTWLSKIGGLESNGNFDRAFEEGELEDKNEFFRLKRKGKGTYNKSYDIGSGFYQHAEHDQRSTFAVVPSLKTPGKYGTANINPEKLKEALDVAKNGHKDADELLAEYVQLAHDRGGYDKVTITEAARELVHGHEDRVRAALAAGMSVPPEVLDEYSDLAPAPLPASHPALVSAAGEGKRTREDVLKDTRKAEKTLGKLYVEGKGDSSEASAAKQKIAALNAERATLRTGAAKAAAPKPSTGFDPAKSYVVDGKEPWEMTAEEWDAARNKMRADDSGAGKLTPSSHAEHIGRVEKLTLGGVGKSGAEPGDSLPTTHRDVIEAALGAGKSVSPAALTEYPDLTTLAAVKAVAGESGLAPLHRVREELAKRGLKDRASQDAAIKAARASTVTASNLEGREGITDAERSAAIEEDGGRLGYLSVKNVN